MEQTVTCKVRMARLLLVKLEWLVCTQAENEAMVWSSFQRQV